MKKYRSAFLTGAVMLALLCTGCGGSTEPTVQQAENTDVSETENVSGETAADDELEESFYITEITDEIFARIDGKSFKEDCTLPREDLRYLHVLHKDLDGETHEGEMIVNKHTTRVSKHGLGLAVDINTLYNPYTKVVDGERIVEPANGEPYLDRTADFPYKIDENDLCYKLFTEHGFEWGGAWEDRKDYQHFEIPTDKIAEWYPDN